MLAAFSFLGINWTTIVVHFVVFAVLVVGLTFLVYKPVLKFVRKRQESIQKGLDDANTIKQDGEALRAEYEAKLQTADQEARQVLAEARAEGERLQEEALAEARAEGEAIRAQAREQMEEQRRAMLAALQQDAGTVAVDLVRELLGREVSQEDNERLIAECLTAWSDHE